MGLTHVAVNLSNLTSNNAYTEDFVVDTGALDSMAPASELKKIGIEPVGKREYELANGDRLEFEYGFAKMSFLDEVIATDILFGADDAEPLLGVLALEAAGFIVDPRNERLRKLRARPLKFCGDTAIVS